MADIPFTPLFIVANTNPVKVGLLLRDFILTSKKYPGIDLEALLFHFSVLIGQMDADGQLIYFMRVIISEVNNVMRFNEEAYQFTEKESILSTYKSVMGMFNCNEFDILKFDGKPYKSIKSIVHKWNKISQSTQQ